MEPEIWSEKILSMFFFCKLKQRRFSVHFNKPCVITITIWLCFVMLCGSPSVHFTNCVWCWFFFFWISLYWEDNGAVVCSVIKTILLTPDTVFAGWKVAGTGTSFFFSHIRYNPLCTYSSTLLSFFCSAWWLQKRCDWSLEMNPCTCCLEMKWKKDESINGKQQE